MRLLCWNCRGLGNPCTVRELIILNKEQGPSVLFLSETRLDSVGIEFLRVKLKMVGAFCVQRYHTGGGLAMLWFDQVDVVVSTYSRNHIDARVVKKSSGTGFHVTGFSGNPETHKRKESWALLKHLSSLSSEPWICMGDFNEILDNNERSGRCSRPGWPIEDFRVVVVHIVNFMIWGLWGTLLRGEISEKPNRMMKLLLLLVLIESLPRPLGWISMMECVSLILLCKIQIIALWFFLSLIHNLQGSENRCLDSKQCGLWKRSVRR